MPLVSAPQIGTKYVLTGPDGTRAVFNDVTDADYVGALEDITGLDSPEVRESADNLVQMDGGIHGNFYYGRRPVVMTGKVYNQSTTISRNTALQKIMRASDAMRADATLVWTPDGGEQQYIRLRRQQPLRFSGTGWAKDFQVSLVAADPRIYSSTVYQANVLAGAGVPSPGRAYSRSYPYDYGGGQVLGQLFVTNQGTIPTPPVFIVTGQGTNPTITNWTTGESIYLYYGLGAGDALTIDTLNHTVMLNGQVSRYAAVDFSRTSWFFLRPGVNDLRLSFSSFVTGANLTVQWRDAWL